MAEIQARYGSLHRIARALGVSRPNARIFLVYYGLLPGGGRPKKYNGPTQPIRWKPTARELRERAGWPPLEGYRSNL